MEVESGRKEGKDQSLFRILNSIISGNNNIILSYHNIVQDIYGSSNRRSESEDELQQATREGWQVPPPADEAA